MKIQKLVAGLIVLIVCVLAPTLGFAQITSNAKGMITEYSSGNQDSIYVFCGKKGEINASLTATSPTGEVATFDWLKYNTLTGTFDFFSSDISGSTSSTISPLQDGAYRVNITPTGGVVATYTAWVFNNYSEAAITNSDCNSFTLVGTSPVLTYVDFPTGTSKTVKGILVNWTAGSETVSTFLTAQVFSPPYLDTDYTLTVSYGLGCISTSVVKYISIVTKADFTYVLEEQKGVPTGKKEAPLTVTFTNKSLNYTPGTSQWFIYKDRAEIILESQANPGAVIDSFLTKLFDDGPIIYVFQKPGAYNVKLVSQKKSEFTTCYDTVYIDNFIEIQESFLEAPNFFTPGGSIGQNDEFVVRFFSMKTVKISIFNRWGKIVHIYENNNVQGFGATRASYPESIWDGKVGGKLAVPGVYYYVVNGIGRDDKRRKANGFVHLFRGK